MRLFIAIHLNQETKESAKGVQDSFRMMNVWGNYTPEENMHLTLAFIGEYGDPDQVMDALEAVDFEPFTIRMDKVGHFDDLWWAGFEESPELEQLVKKVRRALSDAAIPFDRKRFRAHVTLLRKADHAQGKILHMSIEPCDLYVDRRRAGVRRCDAFAGKSSKRGANVSRRIVAVGVGGCR